MNCAPSSIESLEHECFVAHLFSGRIVFGTAQFESSESLAQMVIRGCADLTSRFDTEKLRIGTAKQRFLGIVISNTGSDRP
jgi:hypothetical protein